MSQKNPQDGSTAPLKAITKIIFEYTYESNNILPTAPLTVATPDLTAAIISLPDSINISETVTITWTVKKIGQGNLVSRMLHDRILFESTPIYTASQTVSIAADDSIIKSAVIRLGCSASEYQRVSYPYPAQWSIRNTAYASGNQCQSPLVYRHRHLPCTLAAERNHLSHR